MKPSATAASSEPPCWKPATRTTGINGLFFAGDGGDLRIHEAPSEACRCLGVPPDLRLTTDPRPRLHTPESVRRANAARLMQHCRRTPLFLNLLPYNANGSSRRAFGVLWWHGRWAC